MPISSEKHPYWYVWASMIQRCTNPNHPSYPRYGGRGIFVCDRWLTMVNFESDMGPRPFPNASLERVNNDDGYRPENCKWATPKEQALNKSAPVGESQYRGVVRNKKAWSCNYYDPTSEEIHHLGTYATPEKAAAVREQFIAMYMTDKAAAIASAKKPRVRNDSKTGVTGVTLTKAGAYHAYVCVAGKRVNIGHFHTLNEAENARQDFLAKQVAGTEV